MTEEKYRHKHKKVHKELHKSLDELMADMITQEKNARPSTTTVKELMEWSYLQTLNPTEEGE